MFLILPLVQNPVIWKDNPEVIQSFTNAIQKGMDYVNTHTPEEIAQSNCSSI